MSVAFGLEVTRSASVRRAAALAAWVPCAGLALSALRIASGPTALLDGPPALRLCAALVCAVGACLLAVVSLRGLRLRAGTPEPEPTTLSVDPDGQALLGQGGGPPRPMVLRASCVLPGLTLVILSPYPDPPQGPWSARPVRLWVGRDAVPGDTWRRLHVWLRWMERGRHGRSDPEPHRT